MTRPRGNSPSMLMTTRPSSVSRLASGLQSLPLKKEEVLVNKDIASGKWVEIKGEIKRMWGELNDDELEKTKGDMTAIGGLIQQRYGQKKEDISSGLKGIYEHFSDKLANKTQKIKEDLRERKPH